MVRTRWGLRVFGVWSSAGRALVVTAVFAAACGDGSSADGGRGSGGSGGRAGSAGASAGVSGTAGSRAGASGASGSGVGAFGASAGATSGGGAGGEREVSAGAGGEDDGAGSAGETSGGSPSAGGSSGEGGESGAAQGGTSGASAGGAGAGGSGTGNAGASSGGAGGTPTCPEGSTGEDCQTCVVYVDLESGSDAGDGLSWADAKASIQAGIDVAAASNPACVVWVTEGTYLPTYKADPFADARSATLFVPAGVSVFGGFAGGELSPAARAIAAHPTIVTGELGTPDLADNLSAVVTVATGSLLDGLTVVGASNVLSVGGAVVCDSGTLDVRNSTFTGNAQGINVEDCAVSIEDSTFEDNAGSNAGIAVSGKDADFVIRRSTFRGNHARFNGGAIFTYGQVLVEDSVFEDNRTDSYSGGAISADRGVTLVRSTFRRNRVVSPANGVLSIGGAVASATTATLEQSLFEENSISGSIPRGGAVYAARALVVDDCTFAGNTATGTSTAAGGALDVGGTLAVTNSRFENNVATSPGATKGGAINCAGGCVARVVSSVFRGNQVTSSAPDGGLGGALSVDAGGLTLVGSLLLRNASSGDGGAISYADTWSTHDSRDGTVAHSTFFENTALRDGGALLRNDRRLTTITNSIFWGNGAGNMGPQILNRSSASTTTLRYSNVQGTGFTGASGNIDLAPAFVSPSGTAPDLRLSAGSPCADTGSNGDVFSDILDLDGDSDISESLPFDLDGAARIQNVTVDMGAYERSP